MTSLVKVLAAGVAAILVLAGAVAADGHARVVIPFDLETDGAAEGVAVGWNGDVYTGLSASGRMLMVPGGDGEATELFALDGLAEGDFGFTGVATGHWGEIYAAVVSSNPELNGVIVSWPDAYAWEHIDGTEAMVMPNGIGAAGDLFVSDSMTGTIWRVHFPFESDAQPRVAPWLADPLLEGTNEMPLPYPVGANGVTERDGVVYVGVTEQSHVVGIPIVSGVGPGEPFVYAQLPGVAVDGIAFDRAGNLYVADPPAHTLWKYEPDGTISAVADVDDGLSGPSSVALWEDEDGLVAYVSNQAIGDPSTIEHGPSIIAIELG